MAMGEYFEKFYGSRNSSRMAMNGEWPPLESFSEPLPELYADLLQALPMPDYTHPAGKFNLLSSFPSRDVIAPNLEPKLYIGQGYSDDNDDDDDDDDAGDGETSKEDDDASMLKAMDRTDKKYCGTMNLLIELADSMHLCVHAAPSLSRATFGNTNSNTEKTENVRSLAAVWDIFRAEDADKIHHYIFEHVWQLSKSDVKSNNRSQETPPPQQQQQDSETCHSYDGDGNDKNNDGRVSWRDLKENYSSSGDDKGSMSKRHVLTSRATTTTTTTTAVTSTKLVTSTAKFQSDDVAATAAPAAVSLVELLECVESGKKAGRMTNNSMSYIY